VTVIRNRVRHDFQFRRLNVRDTRWLTTEIIRITFEGDMSGFTSLGPTDHVKVFFPGADGQLNAPWLDDDGRIQRDPTLEYISRDYTPLNWSGSRLDLDFVVHDNGGPAAGWAKQAEQGDEVVVGGPRGSQEPPTGADWWLLIADSTAIPALGRWFEQAPVGQEVKALVFGDESLAEYPLPADADVEWVLGDFDPEPYVRDLNLTDGTGYVWAAGEATSLVGLRRYLRRELGWPRERVDVDGYWRKGIADADHHAPIDPQDPDN